ncbi:uncharacterized protein LOC120331446 [Styela clava]
MLRKNSRNKNVTIINIGNRTIPQETAWVSQFEIIFVGAILMCLLNLRLQIMKNLKDFHLYKDYEDWTITANAFITVVTIAVVFAGGLMAFSQQYILKFDDGPETFIT